MHLKIDSVAYYTPKNKISSLEIEQKVAQTFPKIPFGILEEMTGVKTRYFIWEWEYASDLAIQASQKCFAKSQIKKEEIDLLIFASASQDIIEPATWNIVQKWLWLSCPIFDVKNACNSFLNGLEIANAFIQSGMYKNILICSGETPSLAIKYDVENKKDFKQYFAGYTFGDGWAAMIVCTWDDTSGIQKTYFYSDGENWDLGTILWWGSRFPHEDMWYFKGEPGKLRDKFKSIGSESFEEK